MVRKSGVENTAPHVLLMTRAGCHLCDEAQRVVIDGAEAAGVSWSGHDVDADPELRAEFGDLVPVVLVAPGPPTSASADDLLSGARAVGHFTVTSAALAGAIDRMRGH